MNSQKLLNQPADVTEANRLSGRRRALRYSGYVLLPLILFPLPSPWPAPRNPHTQNVGPASPHSQTARPARIKIPGLEEEWFGVYVSGKKIGYSYAGPFQPDRKKSPLTFRREIRTHMKLTSMGHKFDLRVNGAFIFSAHPPYRLLKWNKTETQGPFKQTITLRKKKGNLYVLKIISGTDERRLQKPLDFTLGDYTRSNVWFRQAPRVGDVLRARYLIAEDLSVGDEQYHVLKKQKRRIQGVWMDYYNVRLEQEGAAYELEIGSNGQLLSLTLGSRFALRSEPGALAQKIEYSSDLFEFGRVKIDRPLGDPRTLRRLVIELPLDNARYLSDGPGQRVTRSPGKNTALLKLDVKYPDNRRPTPGQIKSALAETSRYPIHHPRVRELAQKASGGEKNPHRLARRLVSFVSDYIQDSYADQPLTVLDIIRTRRGDCTEHSALFTTLARSLGIPAREVDGLVYLGDEEQAFGAHSWNEVFIENRRIPLDPTWGENRANAGHIRIGYDDKSRNNLFLVMEKLRLRLIEVRHH